MTRVHGEPVATDALLFVGNRHEAFPVWVIQDPILEPVDKVIWMVIKLHARGTGSRSEFPSYVDICRHANIAAKSTVARSIAILRITRWLSLCARVREPCGRFRHNIYALHDEPIPLPDALHFDPQYLQFVKESRNHGHSRVRNVSRGVFETLDEQIASRGPACDTPAVVEQRLAAAAVLNGDSRTYFGFSGTATARLRRFKGQVRNSVLEQSPQPADAKNSNHRSSSALDISQDNKTQTTTTGGLNFEPPADHDFTGNLIFPSRFTSNQRELAERHLAAVPARMRQRILDETEGRFQAERRGMPVVYDDLRFLASLCRAALAGEFQANLGLKIDAERQRRLAEHSLPDARAENSQRQRVSKATAQASLTTLRAVLGMPRESSGLSEPTREAD